MYDGKSRGWEMFFLALRHYLEKHSGKPRTNVVVMYPVKCSLNEEWEKLTGVAGLAASVSFAGGSPGTHYSVNASTGDKLEGEILINRPPKTWCITVENMGDGLISGTFEEMGGTT